MSSPTQRPMGIETEYGILDLNTRYGNPVALSAHLVEAYAPYSRAGLCHPDGQPAAPVRWDYEGEDPLLDMRGTRLERAAAHESQLTDCPDAVSAQPSAASGPSTLTMTDSSTGHAPGGGDTAGTVTTISSGDHAVATPAPLAWQPRLRPSQERAALARPSTVVLANGGRFYVDHAHPEYATPEVLSPRDLLCWDRAGDHIIAQALQKLGRGGVAVYKNNIDGKGAAYGCHENYLLARSVPFDEVIRLGTAFLITRPLLVGAGRVGLGERSERPGFQVAQRSDYVQSLVGLQTTFNRPIINTRDEPHADASQWRRLHVINGDANNWDVPTYLKVASTAMLLWLLEAAQEKPDLLGEFADLQIEGDSVEHLWALTHDLSLSATIPTSLGQLSGLDIQRLFLRTIERACETCGYVDADTREALDTWARVIELCAAWAQDPSSDVGRQAAADVEWIAKYELCQAQRARLSCGWDDPRIIALDLSWGDLRPGAGVAARLRAAGRSRILVSDADALAACTQAPATTRAALRGWAVRELPSLVEASWTSLMLDPPQASARARIILPPDVRSEARSQAVAEEQCRELAAATGDLVAMWSSQHPVK